MKDQIHVEKEKKRGKVVLRTQYALFPVLLFFERKHSAATQHRSEGHGTATHGSAGRYAALRCAAGLYIAGLV